MSRTSGIQTALFSLLLATVAATPLHAQQTPPLPTADPLGAAMFTASGATGMVVVVVRDKDVFMQSYGEQRPHSGQRPAPESLIRLCSLTKIIATDLLVKLAVDHLVDFTDPLQKFASSGAIVPTRTLHGEAERGITLGDLATHTAGLPREVGWPPDGTPHFTFPDHAYRWEWLPKQRLRFSPGKFAAYSNIGFDLLGDALEQASGKPYAQLFQERTATPLGLRDTTLTPTPEQCSRLMIGFKDEGPCTDTQASAGSGGMYSTPNDMVRWLQYLLGLPGVPVQQNSAAQAVYILPSQLNGMKGLSHAGEPSGIGLGWIHLGLPEEPGMITEKTGGGGGFTTYIALVPARHTGIFVAMTEGRHSGHVNIFHEANNLVTLMAGLPPLPPEPVADLPSASVQAHANLPVRTKTRADTTKAQAVHRPVKKARKRTR